MAELDSESLWLVEASAALLDYIKTIPSLQQKNFDCNTVDIGNRRRYVFKTKNILFHLLAASLVMASTQKSKIHRIHCVGSKPLLIQILNALLKI